MFSIFKNTHPTLLERLANLHFDQDEQPIYADTTKIKTDIKILNEGVEETPVPQALVKHETSE